jgi:hypothetical protein
MSSCLRRRCRIGQQRSRREATMAELGNNPVQDFRTKLELD